MSRLCSSETSRLWIKGLLSTSIVQKQRTSVYCLMLILKYLCLSFACSSALRRLLFRIHLRPSFLETLRLHPPARGERCVPEPAALREGPSHLLQVMRRGETDRERRMSRGVDAGLLKFPGMKGFFKCRSMETSPQSHTTRNIFGIVPYRFWVVTFQSASIVSTHIWTSTMSLGKKGHQLIMGRGRNSIESLQIYFRRSLRAGVLLLLTSYPLLATPHPRTNWMPRRSLLRRFRILIHQEFPFLVHPGGSQLQLLGCSAHPRDGQNQL